ncbi:IS66 family transposase [Desulfosediminicola ganghwensis]|uniref:IS66 family transposase n=1 Tax=Desulfosediminicola ganghwensis TaxID=2569540 RepID=UPI00226AB9BB|nr:transposase [Desulfosediminicola ganghwensis]
MLVVGHMFAVNLSMHKKAGSTDVALNYIRRLYAVEKESEKYKLSSEESLSLRRKKAKPALDEFFFWLSKKTDQVILL